MQDVDILDDTKGVSAHEVDVLFAQYSKNAKVLSFPSFCKLVVSVAKRRHPGETAAGAMQLMLSTKTFKQTLADICNPTHSGAALLKAQDPQELYLSIVKSALHQVSHHMKGTYNGYLKTQNVLKGFTLASFTKFVRDFDIVPTLCTQRGMRDAYKNAKLTGNSPSNPDLTFEEFLEAVGRMALSNVGKNSSSAEDIELRIRHFIAHMEMSNGRQKMGLPISKWVVKHIRTNGNTESSVCA